MKCVMCDNSKSLKKKRETIKYTACGLDNVTLKGVDYAKCDKCGEEYYGLGDQEKLHQLIASALIRKSGPLNGKEVRFLRKHLGYATEVFSKIVDYDVSTISRIENGKQAVQKHYDLVMRLAVLSLHPDRNYSVHDLLEKKSSSKAKTIEVQSQEGHWKIAA